MRSILGATLVAVILGGTFASAAPDQGDREKRVTPAQTRSQAAPAPSQLATLRALKAVPMKPAELDAVKGMHVHFLTPNGKLHLAGDVKTENNWSNIGGTDGVAVAPSYNGLCVAHGSPGVFIPTGPLPITSQCP